MPTLLTLLEIPGIQVALAIGLIQTARSQGTTGENSDASLRRSNRELIHELLTSRSMILLVGGLYLTAALAITFPFNLMAGIPIYFAISKALCN